MNFKQSSPYKIKLQCYIIGYHKLSSRYGNYDANSFWILFQFSKSTPYFHKLNCKHPQKNQQPKIY